MKNRITLLVCLVLFCFVYLISISFWRWETKEKHSNNELSNQDQTKNAKADVVVNTNNDKKIVENQKDLNFEINTKQFEEEIKKYDAKLLLKDTYNNYYLSQNALAIKLQDYRPSMGKKLQEWEGKWIIYNPSTMGTTSDFLGTKSYPVMLGTSQQGILIPLRTLKIFLKDKNFEDSAKNFIEHFSEKIEKTDYLAEIKTFYVHTNSPRNMLELYKICLSENNSTEFTCAPEFYNHLKIN